MTSPGTRASTHNWRALVTRNSASPAAGALAIYTLLLISRLPEMFPFIAIFRPMILLALVMVALAWALPRTGYHAVLAARESRAVLAMFLLAAASIPTSYWPGDSFRFVFFNFWKTLLFFFLLLYCIRTLSELRYLVMGFVGAIASLGGGVLFLNVQERARITGTYDPNDLAFVVVCALPVAVVLLLAERGFTRYAMIPIIMLGLVTIIATKSRGGFIALIVVGAIILGKLPARVRLLQTGLALGAVAVFLLLAPQAYWERVGSLWSDAAATGESSQDGYLNEGFSVRRRVWSTGIQMIFEHPILGVGAAAFAPAAVGRIGDNIGYKGAHNSFIQVGAELGLLGLALLVYLLYRAIRNCRLVIRLARSVPELRYQMWIAHGLEAAIYGYIIGGAALNHGYSAILYYLIGTSVVLKWVTVRDRARSEGRSSPQPKRFAGSVPWWKAPR
jgi:O-antigen ligase